MILISGSFTYQVLISCCGCGKQALSRHHTHVQQASASEMQEILQAQFRTEQPDIPIGWSMNGRDKLSCESCKPS
jgi:hypothetical protein